MQCVESFVDERSVEVKIADLESILMPLPGLQLEVCGKWLWVGGNTKEHKEVLKSLNFHYAPKKQKWYWRDETDKSANKRHRPCSMQYIRNKYGSQVTDTAEA
jgi:hypothetical protein